MKENATHIRLIRDKDGKPVEAEYLNTTPEPSFVKRMEFVEWRNGHHIPVTGDWPTDKNVFAMDEVEEYERATLNRDGTITSYTALRLKAIISDWKVKKQERFEEAERLFEQKPEATLSDDRQSEVTVKEGECPTCKTTDSPICSNVYHFKPKQEAKTADIYEVIEKRLCENKYLKPVWQFQLTEMRNIVASELEAYKQQYQQEIIEKLEAATAELRKSLPKGPHIHALSLLSRVMSHLQSLDEIIQSTK